MDGRYDFEHMKDRLEQGECARREGWAVSDIIVCRNTIFYNADDDKVVELSEDDKAAKDWIVYRKG